MDIWNNEKEAALLDKMPQELVSKNFDNFEKL